MSKQAQFIEDLRLTNEEREMNKFVRDCVETVLAQMEEHTLLVGALNFAFDGNGPLLQRAIDAICESDVLGISALRQGPFLAVAVAKYKIPPSLLLNSAQAALGTGNSDMHHELRYLFEEADQRGELKDYEAKD